MIHQMPDKLLNATYLDENKLCMMRVTTPDSHVHEHEFLELAYVMQGSAEHQIGTSSTTIREGDFLLVDFGTIHGYKNGQDLVIVNCLFTPEYVDRALTNSPSLLHILSTNLRQFDAAQKDVYPTDCILHDEDGYVRQLMNQMLQEYTEKNIGYLEIIRCHLIEILVHALRFHVAESQKHCHPVVAAIINELQKHYSEPLSLTELGQDYGYTPQYLSHLFHQETGVSLSTYLQRLRVEEAYRLLTTTTLRISEIAEQVGYTDIKHFNTVFRKHFNMSPKEVRKT